MPSASTAPRKWVASAVPSLLVAGLLGLGCDRPAGLGRLEAAFEGLRGSGLVLTVNGREVAVQGTASVLLVELARGSRYEVAVKTQPTGPAQRCSTSDGAGAMGAGVATVHVTCADSRGFGGTVTGLLGSGLVLRLRLLDGTAVLASQELPIVHDGAFAFTERGVAGELYTVSIATAPAGPEQVCTVQNGGGTIPQADVRNVQVICSEQAFAVGGTVEGLRGAGLVLRLNGTEDLPVQASGAFSFAQVANGAPYTIAVSAAPAGPAQTCTVADGAGTVTGADVTSVAVSCHVRWATVAVGAEHTLAISADGVLYAWGRNAAGQLGDGTRADGAAPVRVGRERSWVAAAAGAAHSVAIAADGTLWAWGRNADGQLGNGGRTDSPAPVQIGQGQTWTRVASGGDHTLAIAQDGTLWGWGANGHGQLGDGTTTPRDTPIQIGAGRRWAVAAAADHSLAVGEDGTLWAWGANPNGEVGNRTIGDELRPVQIGADHAWRTAAAGRSHSAAVAEDGSLWTWGANGAGQLGDGTSTARAEPGRVTVAGATFTAVSLSDDTIALAQGGDLWGFGQNLGFQLGADLPGNWATPRPVQAGTVWKRVAARDHTLAIAEDDALWGWGINTSGQLGDGTVTSRTAPVRIW